MQSFHEEQKKQIVNTLLRRGVLITPDMLAGLEEQDMVDKVRDLLQQSDHKDVIVLTEHVTSLLRKEAEPTHISSTSEPENETEDKPNEDRVYVGLSYDIPPKKRDVSSFVAHFNNRRSQIQSLLMRRPELQNISSIRRISGKKDKEQVAIVGMIYEISQTKNGNLLLTVEDHTGSIKALIHKNKPELLAEAKDLVVDEVIGISGVAFEDIVFVNSLIWPDVSFSHELKKAPHESYIACLSDLHVGSNLFLPEDFDRFLRWINCEVGNDEQKRIASLTKYVFVSGDLVDGVGIYPGQETELSIPDIFEQYKECSRLLAQIPERITLIICPGNHDALRLAEPQPSFESEVTKPLRDLPNVVFVSNPGRVTIEKSETFPGFDVLLYHGYSFDHFIREVDSLRNNGGYDRADLVMKFLLKRRHLAPSYGSSPFIPESEQDYMVIDKVPDILLSGHIHKSIASTYRNVTMICGSCWQAKTAFQEKVGHNPEPSRVPIVNLQTREVKILRFGS